MQQQEVSIEVKRATLEVLMQQEREGFLRRAARSTGPDDAEDIVQQTFMEAWKNVCSVKDLSLMKNWLGVLFHRKMKKNISVAIERRNTACLDDMLGVSAGGPGQDSATLAIEALERLTNKLTEAEKLAIQKHLKGEDLTQPEHKVRSHAINKMRWAESAPPQLQLFG